MKWYVIRKGRGIFYWFSVQEVKGDSNIPENSRIFTIREEAGKYAMELLCKEQRERSKLFNIPQPTLKKKCKYCKKKFETKILEQKFCCRKCKDKHRSKKK